MRGFLIALSLLVPLALVPVASATEEGQLTLYIGIPDDIHGACLVVSLDGTVEFRDGASCHAELKAVVCNGLAECLNLVVAAPPDRVCVWSPCGPVPDYRDMDWM